MAMQVFPTPDYPTSAIFKSVIILGMAKFKNINNSHFYFHNQHNSKGDII